VRSHGAGILGLYLLDKLTIRRNMAVTLSVGMDNKPENPYTITLEKTSDGGVDVNAVGRYEKWGLLKIKADGTFYRYDYIGETTGFSLNTKGQLVESKKE
jgi:hypothetical protein